MLLNCKNAFSLIELSIALVIISIVLGAGFVATQNQSNITKYEITINRLETIERALTQFLAKNGRLPCPAYLIDSNIDYSYGYEQILFNYNNPATCLSGQGNTTGIISTFNSYYAGAVPFKSLGLSNDFIVDGWNNKITYTTFTPYINNHISNNSCAAHGTTGYSGSDKAYSCFRAVNSANSSHPGAAIIKKINGSSASYYDAIYVLVSFGENGYGAYRATSDNSGINTDRNILPQGDNELSNTLLGQTYYTTGYKIAADNIISQEFDDIIRFKTRNQMLSECNKEYNNFCHQAWNVTPGPVNSSVATSTAETTS